MGQVINGYVHPDFCNCIYHLQQQAPKERTEG
jgi:hypothetical protein